MKVTKTVTKTNNEEVQEQTTVFAPKFYNKLKVVVQVWLPALATFYLTIGQIWGLPDPEKVVASITAVTAFLGVLIGISSKRYNESDAPHDGELIVTEDGGGAAGFLLALDGDPELLKDKSAISFKVKKNQVYDPTP